ncbi:Meiosis specific protein SPO22 [Ascosphaera apis ARSEF 7405]|uniref:Meiosis specific protein SPO22 n=1 Tax=Ascosphaera apis ARSEF 7405 TaxID=392613 RepID=A0A167VR25_9EURO|nr:Meiosis specific protein SPO22 [Ascosphaera apis ARSEF 7405]
MPSASEIPLSRPQTATNNRTLQCLRKILDFAGSLQKCLSAAEEQIISSKPNADGNDEHLTHDTAKNAVDGIDVSALDDVIASISSLPSNITSTKHAQTVIPFAENARVEPLATKIWNQCTRVMRMIEDYSTINQESVYDKLSRGRLFAFLMLEYSAVLKSKDTLKDDIRLLKVAFRTAQTFIETGQLDLALRVLEKAAMHEERLSTRCTDTTKDCIPTPDEQRILRRLSAEYHMLRMAVSWRQKRLDITELMLSKVPKLCIEQEASVAEAFADICYDIGHSHLGEKDFPLAVKWLERAFDALSKHDLGALSPDADELRLAVLHALARAKMVSPDGDSMDVNILTEVLSKEYGNRLPVMLLNIEMISKEPEPDCELYHEKLVGLLRTVPLTDANLNMLSQESFCIDNSVQLMQDLLDLAADALYQLIFQRLVLHHDPVPLERGFVTFIWMQTSGADASNTLNLLQSSATKLHGMTKSINAEATYACLILLWKKIDHYFAVSDYATAEKWLRLARHPIFDNAGEINKSKLSRKLISCYLGNKDTVSARRVYEESSESCKAEILTIYLMHSVALLDDDLNLATSCIEGLCEKGADATVYLQACVAEAQRMGKRHHAALGLQRLLHDLLESHTSEVDHLPVLLRCTVRLLLEELDTDTSKQRAIEEELCNLFDTAMIQAEKYQALKPDTNPFTVTELEWFSRNSYNLAVQYCSMWAPQIIQKLLTVCIKFIDLHPKTSEVKASTDLAKRRMLCNFLGAIISMAQARATPDVQIREEHYAASRSYILGFRQYLLECSDLDEDSLEKHKTILAFDFEAAVRLHQFSDLTEIVDESQQYASEELYGIFIDAMLGSDAPVEVVSAVFQQIILHLIRKSECPDATKISRWLRCLFQISLDSNVEVAEAVLDQAYAIAREAHHKHLENKTINTCYPADEIEWLATTGFNKAVDFYLSGGTVPGIEDEDVRSRARVR